MRRVIWFAQIPFSLPFATVAFQFRRITISSLGDRSISCGCILENRKKLEYLFNWIEYYFFFRLFKDDIKLIRDLPN